MIENYDPNNMFGKTTWKLTFKMWGYELIVVKSIGGNCKGLSTLEYVLESYVEDLFTDVDEDCVEIEFVNPDSETLIVDLDEDGDPEEKLKNMLVKAELISFEKDAK